MNRLVPLGTLASAMLVTALAASCTDLKPVARTTHDVAKQLCELFYTEKNGITIEEAGRAFCTTERDLRPWLDEVLKAKQRASLAREKAGQP